MAQLLYRMLSGAVFDKDQSDPIAGVFGKCREIITSAGLDQRAGVVPLDACNELRVMIQHHPLYRGVSLTTMHEADGI